MDRAASTITDMRSFYLATPPNGHLPYADATVSEGVTLHAVAPNPPFEARGLWAVSTPLDALALTGWPCRLFEVTGDPTGKVARRLRSFDELYVIQELSPELVLGPTAGKLVTSSSRSRNCGPTRVTPALPHSSSSPATAGSAPAFSSATTGSSSGECGGPAGCRCQM